MSEETTTTGTCPRCGLQGSELLSVETGMRLALKTTEESNIPSLVCGGCYSELSGMVSRGVKLRLEEQAKVKNKQIMWKSRVNLVKQARQLMQQKAFPEAAVSYEKYLRVLEISHDLNKGALTPEVFNNSTRSKEMTVVATAYWDLLRIYDTSSNYKDRMQLAATKLAQFSPYSPIFPDIIRKAESFKKTAKNPEIVKLFLRLTRKNRPRCFVATVVFLAPMSEELIYLRRFRDEVLKKSPLGRQLTLLYYKASPAFAQWLDNHKNLQKPIRWALKGFVFILKKLS